MSDSNSRLDPYFPREFVIAMAFVITIVAGTYLTSSPRQTNSRHFAEHHHLAHPTSRTPADRSARSRADSQPVPLSELTELPVLIGSLVEPESEEAFEVVYTSVDQMPRIVGGIEELALKIRYPEIARRAGVNGRVFVSFVVNRRGDPVNARIIRGIGAGCDEEALRAVTNSRFVPGLLDGVPVNVRMTLPILFALDR